ncbi:MAG: hypothetical protein [Microviridae sp.]|nr:MAG: hypothetical protein [Microviridae sp.]
MATKKVSMKPKPLSFRMFQQHQVLREMPTGPTMTVPDQSMSVREIMDRFTRGQRIPDKMLGYYDDDQDSLGLDGQDWNSLDLSEKHDLVDAHNQKLGQLKRDYSAQMKRQAESHAKAEKARKEALKAEIRQEMEAPQKQ